jgi:hypothetical protein
MISSIGSTAAGGMERSIRSLEFTAARAANPDRSLEHVERDVVTERVDVATYKANASMLSTADEMVGSLLDIVS